MKHLPEDRKAVLMQALHAEIERSSEEAVMAFEFQGEDIDSPGDEFNPFYPPDVCMKSGGFKQLFAMPWTEESKAALAAVIADATATCLFGWFNYLDGTGDPKAWDQENGPWLPISLAEAEDDAPGLMLHDLLLDSYHDYEDAQADAEEGESPAST